MKWSLEVLRVCDVTGVNAVSHYAQAVDCISGIG